MICVENLSIIQGSFSLHDVSFAIEEGQYAVLTGRSGSGKTTILEAICGLRRIQAGRVQLGDIDVTRLRPAERRVGYVPQDGALFPNYRVGEQLAFALDYLRKRFAREAQLSLLVQFSDNENRVREVIQPAMADAFPQASIETCPLSLTSGAHMGPGTWGLAYLPEFV